MRLGRLCHGPWGNGKLMVFVMAFLSHLEKFDALGSAWPRAKVSHPSL